MAGFIFGGDTGETPESLARKRALAEAMLARATGAAPSNVGEGLVAIGNAIGGRIREGRVNRIESRNRASATKAFEGIVGQAFGRGPSTAASPPSTSSVQPASAAAVADAGDMESRIYRGLVERGVPDHIARGAIANQIAESRLDPGINEANPIVPGSRGGFGLNQWTGPRRRAYEAYAQQRGVPLDDLDTQLDFTMHEMQGPENDAWRALLGTQTAEEAARVYSNKFLRPGIPHMDRRLAEARRLAGVDFGGAAPEMAGANPQREMVAAALARPQPQAGAGNMPGTAQITTPTGDVRQRLAQAMAMQTQTQRPQTMAQPPQDTALGMPVTGAQGPFPPAPARPPQGGQAPMMQTAQAGSDFSTQELVQAASNPWLTDGQRQVLGALLQQRMQAMDPMRQLEMDRMRMEIDQMRNPRMEPMAVGGNLVNPQTGEVIYQSPRDPMTVNPGQTIFDPQSREVLFEAEPEPGYALLTPEQARTMGLPENERWQVSPEGQIKPIGGAQTTVNVNTEGDSAWEKESAKLFAQRYDTLTTQAQSAQQMLGLYDIAQAALDTGMRTGALGAGEQTVRQLGLAMGIGDADKVAGAELLTSVTNRMALQMRNPDSGMGMPGAVSDRDLRFLKDAQIGLDRSPEGNRRMLEAFRALEQRKVEVAALADQYIEQNGRLDTGFNRAVREYAEANPMFPPPDQGDGAADAPEGVDPAIWEVMTPEERALWQN